MWKGTRHFRFIVIVLLTEWDEAGHCDHQIEIKLMNIIYLRKGNCGGRDKEQVTVTSRTNNYCG
jgi:hypothetical protein